MTSASRKHSGPVSPCLQECHAPRSVSSVLYSSFNALSPALLGLSEKVPRSSGPCALRPVESQTQLGYRFGVPHHSVESGNRNREPSYERSPSFILTF
jgi:hypothetical protein